MMIGEQISPTHRLQIVVSPPINAVSNIVHNYYIVPLRALHTVHVYIPTSPLHLHSHTSNSISHGVHRIGSGGATLGFRNSIPLGSVTRGDAFGTNGGSHTGSALSSL